MAPLPPTASLDDVKLRIKNSLSNPNVGQVFQVVLKDGPRVFRVATLFEILDGPTRKFHHYSLRLDSILHSRQGWFAKPEKSIRLESGEPDEIERLYRFLKPLLEGSLAKLSGELRIIRSQDYEALAGLLDVLPRLATTDKLKLMKEVLSRIDASASDVQAFVDAFQTGDIRIVGSIGAAAKLVEYRVALNRLRELVQDEHTDEHVLQSHLSANPWMFGSEYSELLDRRKWTRDDQLDFMLRRTVDDFLEIVEIKTPFRENLLQFDRSHDSYYASAKLSTAVGQTIRYIEEIERHRDTIRVSDAVDTLKIRARIIIGRDGNAAHQTALRNFNAHLHRLEILTFDQLLRISERVLAVFESIGGPNSKSPEDDDLRF